MLAAVALRAILLLAAPAAAEARRRNAPAHHAWRCGAKTYCGEMTRGAEAMFHFRSCGLMRLDTAALTAYPPTA